MKRTRLELLGLGLLALASTAPAADPWIISGNVEITTPLDVGDVVVIGSGSLTVRDVAEPGLRVAGNLVALGDGEIRLERSVVQFLSTFNGQYAFAAMEQGRVTITGCDYRVPSGVQHGIFAGDDAQVEIGESDFQFVQLVAGGRARLVGERLDGQFETLLLDHARIELRDIPRSAEGGDLWLWPEVPAGAELVFSPPLPGFVSSWGYPPREASGIDQSAVIERCQVRLWPLLVRDGCRLELRDIPEESWVIVGLHLPSSITIAGLANGSTAGAGETLAVPVPDRTILLENASIDTWNLYPEGRARVRVVDSHLGELLAMEDSIALLERTVIDGSGGFLGSRDQSLVDVTRSTITCTIEAAQESTIRLHGSLVQPYPSDPTGEWTRFGAYDRARLLADQTPVLTTAELGGQGLIVVTYLVTPPAHPPESGAPVTLSGVLAQYSLDPDLTAGRWLLEARPVWSHRSRVLAQGTGSVEEQAALATWEDADPSQDYDLRMLLVDGWGRTLVGRHRVPGEPFPP